MTSTIDDRRRPVRGQGKASRICRSTGSRGSGLCGCGEAGAFIAERNTAPGGKLPLNTNSGGLSYMHSGMYGMYALQESMRQMRGIAPAQIRDAKVSVRHGAGGMFAASDTIMMSNKPP